MDFSDDTLPIGSTWVTNAANSRKSRKIECLRSSARKIDSTGKILARGEAEGPYPKPEHLSSLVALEFRENCERWHGTGFGGGDYGKMEKITANLRAAGISNTPVNTTNPA
jgi:hypothetical protein